MLNLVNGHLSFLLKQKAKSQVGQGRVVVLGSGRGLARMGAAGWVWSDWGQLESGRHWYRKFDSACQVENQDFPNVVP